jgi:hypothetical protein
MNYLMLLAGLVLVVCLMNNKDLMKSVSSKAKSMNMDDTTLLVIVFVVVVLFMCMSKKVEGLEELSDNICPQGTSSHKIQKIEDDGSIKYDTVIACFNPDEVSVLTKNNINTLTTVPVNTNDDKGDTSINDKPIDKPIYDKPNDKNKYD